MKRFTKALMTTTMAIAAGALIATSAMATEGLFSNGTGARNKALAGAGVADQNDPTAMSINPAGLVHSDNQLTISGSLFSPRRSFTAQAGGLLPAGNTESESNYFLIPNIAWSHRIDGSSVFGLSMYGNGGMNSDFEDVVNPTCAALGGGSGIYCAGPAGIDLTQIFLSAGYAQSMGNLSWGVAPIVAINIFKAKGLGAFGALGFSATPGSMTNQSNEIAVGVGVRGGVELALTDNFRVAVAGQTRTYMQKLTNYKGLFAEQGGLDTPATVTAGVALDVTPTFTIMADYKHIFYSDVKSIGNTSTTAGTNLFGNSNGPGFGWNDINVYKVGVEWDVSPDLTLRAGYAYNDQPVQSEDVMLNVLAPGVVQHHFTGGARFRLTDSIDMEIAGMYAPKESVSGPALPAMAGFGLAQDIEIDMFQWELTAGIVWKLGQTEAPLK